jgi:hypothetical protein
MRFYLQPKKHCIPEDVIIHKDTIRQRVKRNARDGHIGQRSPMLNIETYLVELIMKLVEMRTPITTIQGLELANSLISGTSIIDKVVAWKRDNCAAFQKNGTIKLGKSYWAALMRRNRHLIRSKKGSNSTINALSGALTLIWRKCTMISIKIFVPPD